MNIKRIVFAALGLVCFGLGTVTLLMGFGIFMMARKGIVIPCIILGVEWLLHVLYFVFRVKTISQEENRRSE